MTQILHDKVIFLTGAAGRVGIAAVRMLVEKGAVVVATDIIPLEQSAKLVELREKYDESQFVFIQADISEEDQVAAAYQEVDRRFGRLDGLFHNAYKQAVKPTAELPLEEWNAGIKGTLTSTFLVNKHAIPYMIKSGGGSIVNTSSVLSQLVKKNNAAYGASKAGINQFTRIVALEYADQGIRSNAILPGDFKSDKDFERLGDKKDDFNARFLLGRTGNPEEIVELAAYLLSDAAEYVTGSLMVLDGGLTLR